MPTSAWYPAAFGGDLTPAILSAYLFSKNRFAAGAIVAVAVVALMVHRFAYTGRGLWGPWLERIFSTGKNPGLGARVASIGGAHFRPRHREPRGIILTCWF